MEKMTNGEFVTKWVLDTVKKEYPQDIALVVAHSTLRINPDEKVMSYFVPATDKGMQFGQTFILGGEGFDIWGIDWQRMERFANLEEYNTTCLADGELIYARTPEDEKRFKKLKKRQAENLKNPVLQRANALKDFERAKQIYLEMAFSKGGDVRLCAGFIMDFLGRSLCFSKGGYFKRAQTEQLAELLKIGALPKGFPELCGEIITENGAERQKELCRKLITIVEDYLLLDKPQETTEHNFQDLAYWYEEMTYTFLRIRHYTKLGDVTKVFMWGCMVQKELNSVSEDFGIEKMDLLCEFSGGNLQGFVEHMNKIEVRIREIINGAGVKIREYETREEFLNEV